MAPTPKSQGLVKQRGVCKAQLTRMKTFLDNCTENTTLSEIKVRYEALSDIFKKYDEIQNEIEISDESEQEINDRLEFEEKYFSIKAKMDDLLSSNDNKDDVVSNHSARPLTSNKPLLKLPAIKLPTFDGKYETWLAYSDAFKVMVHNNENISTIQKFYYLVSTLKLEAAQLIKNLAITEANYPVAWQLLVDRYENKKLISSAYVGEILNIKSVVKEDASELRHFINTATSNLNALKALELDKPYHEIILEQLFRDRLDFKTRREWEMKNSTQTFPSLSDFFDFLEKKCQALESLVSSNTNSSISNNKNIKSKLAGDWSKQSRTAHHSSSFVVTGSKNCELCREQHSIYKCHKFSNLSIEQKTKFIRDNSLCYNCLRTGHILKNCTSSGCRICKRKHHTLIHKGSAEPSKANVGEQSSNVNNSVTDYVKNKAINASKSANEGEEGSMSYCAMKSRIQPHILLSTALVKVKDGYGNFQTCRLLLDSASQSNFITESCVQRLGLRKINNPIPIVGINNSLTDAKHSVRIELFSNYSNFKTNISCSILPKITSVMPATLLQPDSWSLPQNLQWADPYFFQPGHIEILVGAEIYLQILGSNKMSRPGDYPIICETELGWILSGKTPPAEITVAPSETYFVRTDDDLQLQLTKFWELEEITTVQTTKEEDDCEKHFLQNTVRDDTGRFVVKLPFKLQHSQLGDSFDLASSRHKQLEKRFQKNPCYYKQYVNFIEEYKALGHMKIADPKLNNSQNQYFLPHHAVMKESSTTTKFRVVFDGSAKTTSGTSLNDTLMVGATVQQDLYSIMLRFRTHPIVFTADIAKMYRQIQIDSEDCKYQQILWRERPTDSIECYELTTVTYGTASAPFLATRCLKKLAEDEQRKYPLAAEILKNDFYVDDLVSGASDIKTALKIQADLITLLSSAGFQLRKWSSNCSEILHSLAPDLVEDNMVLQLDKSDSKTLGFVWSPISDTFQIAHNDNINRSKPVTKREVASIVASIFDPLGLISPVVILYKIFLQQLWLCGINWDDTLPSSLLTTWNKLVQQLPYVKEIRIPRQAIITHFDTIQIHGFCDASQQAYGACLYVRSVDKSGQILIQLLCSKSRVAPVKTVSLPRLELCGMLLLAKLLQKTVPVLNTSIDNIFLWTDSTICLAWISSPATRWKVFVSNRVAQIQEMTKHAIWCHVPTNDNPADLITRGVPVNNISQGMWFRGPEWLSQDSNSWPHSQDIKAQNIPEERPIASLVHTVTIPDNTFVRYSRLSKLLRIIAYCKRFIYNSQRSQKKTGALDALELDEALKSCILMVQHSTYRTEIKSLQENLPIPKKSPILSLHPFIDSSNLLRVGGRLQNADIAYDQKHQFILPPNHHFTILLVRHEHLRLLHGSSQIMLASLRQRFWIPKAKQLIKKLIHQCTTCFRMRASSTNQLMGQLPKDRVQSGRPFMNTGVDYAGPFTIKGGSVRSKSTTKCYVALFICFATRAIHLELVSDLTSQAFIAALRRFISRRGNILNLYSDNGTNFIGAERNLTDLKKLFLSQNFVTDVNNFAAMSNFSWHFIPPYSPHFGGLWEAGIKSMKYHLKRVVGKISLTFEEFSTLLTQIEAILNSRPMCTLSDDPDEPSYLSPGHFLIGSPITSFPEPSLSDLSINRLTRWQHLQQMRQQLWSRWSKDYLNSLQQRKKWKSSQPNVEIGMVVLVKDDHVPPLNWRLGVIKETFPGSDGLTRVVSVKIGDSVTKRSISKIIVLPLNS